jgi:putative transcriptional regulator
MKAGIFINSTSLLDETIFENTLIFITEHNERGAMGYIVNKAFPRKLNELEEFKEGIPFPLYEGGPVDPEHLYFIHQRPDLIVGGEPVTDHIYLGGDFKAAVQYINMGMLTGQDIKIFVGYCGWDDGEIEAEIAEGSWKEVEAGNVFGC